MDMTNMAYGILILFALVGTAMTVWLDATNNYPTLVPQAAEMPTESAQANFTASVVALNETISSMTVSSQKVGSTDNWFSATLGYLAGLFEMISTFIISFPSIMMNVVSLFSAMTGGLVPSFVITAIIIAISLTMVLGFAYYWLKVR
jgi:hypothetical protein